MTVFHFLNCAFLTFGPHVVYYSATPLYPLPLSLLPLSLCLREIRMLDMRDLRLLLDLVALLRDLHRRVRTP